MEFNKKIIIFMAILLAGLLVIGAASAADITSTDNATGAEPDSALSATNDNEKLEINENNNVLTASPKTFTDLNNTINGNSNKTIDLYDNYAYNDGTDNAFTEGIVIDREVSIDGHGITIDGSRSARIFNINTNDKVTFKNITFTQGHLDSGDGGAIYGSASSSYTAINCTFSDNQARTGGAMYYGTAIGCTFSCNTAFYGGAMFSGTAIGCTFSGNNAWFGGGAMSGGTAIGCTFSGNSAIEDGGAMLDGYEYLCIFENYAADCYNTDQLSGVSASLSVSNTVFSEDEKSLTVYLTCEYQGEKYRIDNFNATISILQNGAWNDLNVLTGKSSVIDLSLGVYLANFTVKANNSEVNLTGVKLKFTDGTTFSDLNKIINGNTANEIDLYKNYKFNSTTDSEFTEGIIIDREVSIDGHGITIDGSDSARIFKINTNDKVTFKNITFTQGFLYSGFGGAIYGSDSSSYTVINCTFSGNEADRGGAMYGGTAINCTFSGNIAGFGGAMFGGTAIGCTFSGNSATGAGGAMSGGTAIGCTFSGNSATGAGGAMSGGGTAIGCTFSGNTADSYGGAMLAGYEYLCIFENYAADCYYTGQLSGVSASLSVSNTIFSEDEKRLTVYLTCEYQGEKYQIDNFNATISILQDGTWNDLHVLTGKSSVIDLQPGVYLANFTVKANNSEVKRDGVQLKVTDGTTFWDLNKTINGNTANEITLDKNYKFNEAVDSEFTEGIIIDRAVTINGNGHTINATGKARIFYVTSNTITIKNITFTNGYADKGGAIYFKNDISNSSIDATFINNNATWDGGANYFQEPLSNVNITGDYTSNTAYWEGGANYFKNTLTNATITGNYTNNKATNGNGGANHFNYQITNVAIMGDYTNNTAINGGANYFTELTNVTITGNYTNNKATNGDGGANHFSDKQNNVTITGDYTSNTANANGGANCFYSYLINVTITGDYTSNTASNYNGGANYFHEELTNVAITGDYTSNTANANGGANCFNSYLINVNITGTFTNNKATNDDGGANSFLGPLTNVTITGDYTANKANGYGGANSFLNPLTNVTISGDYTGNTACDGGANYFSKITNVNITGEYTANKALGSGGAIYFAIETNYLNVRGVFINNSGFYIIFIDKSIENNVIRDSIFLNNNAKNINLDQGDIQLVNNWFGNNATNYNVTPDTGSVTPDNWLFLNATVDPVKFTSSTNVTFKLDSYDANTKNVTDYNNNLISPIELTLTSTNATVKNSTHLNETVKYVAGDGEKGSVTATFENAQYTIELQTDKKNPKLSVESETFNYNETMALALSYNPNATGNVSVTLNGKKHIYNYTGLALNVTVMLSGDILPDEYNVTVMYGGDVNFFGTSANSTLTVKKANSTLKVTDITFDYNGTGSCEVTYTNATGVTAEVIGHNEATINVTNNLITVSGLDAGNYTLSVTTITSEGYSNVTKTSKITVKPTPSLVSAENVNVTYGEDIIIEVRSVNATEIRYEIVMKNDVVASGTVMSGENVTGLNLAAGTYTVNLTTIVDSNHIQSTGQSLLTVKKALSRIDVNGTEAYYKNDAVLNYAVVNATGVNVDIVDWAGNPMKSGVDYNISISKSQIIIDFFNDGRYVANVTTITDNNHTSACMGAEIRVLPVIDLEISIAPENQTAHYGDTLSWKVIIVNHGPSMAENLYLDFFADDGIIFTDQYGKQYAKHYRFSDVYPIGVDYPFICILKTLANATDAELCFNVTVGDIYSIYPNLSKYNASASVKVEHASANISVNADSQIVVGDSLTVTVELPSDATGNVTVTVDGEKYIGTINDGIATISIPDLAAGEKTAIISYPGDNRYSPINETRDITVSRKNTTADISAPTSITLGDDASVDVKLPGDAKGNVTVIVDGEILDTVPLSNGAVDVTLPEMKAGNHTVEVIYSGDEKYNPVSETKNITVLKQNATAEVSLPENVTYGDDESVDVILPGDATGNVTVKVDGDDVGSVEVVNGSASVALPTLSAGDHAVEVVYSGDDKYAPVSQTVNVAVVKSTPKLTSNKKTFKNTDKYKKYTVSLKDSKGNAIVNATVTLKVNGKTYTAKTNSNGKATFKLTKLTKKGTYTAVIKFAGDEKYNNSSAKAKINVKSTWKIISKGSSYHTMVKKIQRALKNHGLYIKYNKRYLKVDGIFHIYTEMAVKQFQKANGLKQTGRVDEITAKELGLI